MAPKVLFDLFSPKVGSGLDVSTNTFRPKSDGAAGSAGDTIPPPPKAVSAITTPDKKK